MESPLRDPWPKADGDKLRDCSSGETAGEVARGASEGEADVGIEKQGDGSEINEEDAGDPAGDDFCELGPSEPARRTAPELGPKDLGFGLQTLRGVSSEISVRGGVVARLATSPRDSTQDVAARCLPTLGAFAFASLGLVGRTSLGLFRAAGVGLATGLPVGLVPRADLFS